MQEVMLELEQEKIRLMGEITKHLSEIAATLNNLGRASQRVAEQLDAPPPAGRTDKEESWRSYDH